MKTVAIKGALFICQFQLVVMVTMLASWVHYVGEGSDLGMRSCLFSFPAGLASFILLKGPLTWRRAGLNLLICVVVGVVLGRINFHTA